MLRLLLITLTAFVFATGSLHAAARVFSLPAELQSNHFTLKVDGQAVPVAHAATTYYFRKL